MEKHLKSIVLALSIAFLLGGVEMRVAVGRLEATVSALDKRVERIEHDLDNSRPTLASKE